MTGTAKSKFRMYVSLAAAALLLTFLLITDSTEVVHGAVVPTVCNGSCDHPSWECDGGTDFCIMFACCAAEKVPCVVEDWVGYLVCDKSEE